MALFLSHDVDQVHDRGFYRTLGDLNHLRRQFGGGEAGDARMCLRRVSRSVFTPKVLIRPFEAILRIEGQYGWRSTFFFLEGARWSRYGARYSLKDRRVRDLGRVLLDAGCELGVHGGWYDLDDADGYRRSADGVDEAFGVRPVGIRNHFLRFSGASTWRAQQSAGFEYDATFGWNDRLGPREGRLLPFEPELGPGSEARRFVVLPLGVMDTTLFRHLGLRREAALAAAVEVVDRTAQARGLLTLLWHNNFFDEPEYRDWQEVYEKLLAYVASQKPWCATGAEIADFWRNRDGNGERQEGPGD